MQQPTVDLTQVKTRWWLLFRLVLFAASLSLLGYIPFKYLTAMHSISGMYAFLFPLSGFLAAAGVALAVKPVLAFRATPVLRAGVAAIGVLWLVEGAKCVPTLLAALPESPLGSISALTLASAHHAIVPLGVMLFAFVPLWLLGRFGITVTFQAPDSSASRDRLDPVRQV